MTQKPLCKKVRRLSKFFQAKAGFGKIGPSGRQSDIDCRRPIRVVGI